MTSFWGHQDNPFPPDEPAFPRCPVCGEECETIYTIDRVHKVGNVYSINNYIIGCNMCYNPDDFPGEDVQEGNPWEDYRCMEDY